MTTQERMVLSKMSGGGIRSIQQTVNWLFSKSYRAINFSGGWNWCVCLRQRWKIMQTFETANKQTLESYRERPKLTSVQRSATVGEKTLVCCHLVCSKWSSGQTHSHTSFSHVWRQFSEWWEVWTIVGEVLEVCFTALCADYFYMCLVFEAVNPRIKNMNIIELDRTCLVVPKIIFKKLNSQKPWPGNSR